MRRVVSRLLIYIFIIPFTLLVALQLVHPRRRKLADHPRNHDIPYEEVRFRGPAGMIAAWYLPGTNGRTLIGLHGIADNRQQWLAPAIDLQRRGYASLLMDFRAHGESEGRFSSYGDLETGDIAAAVEYLRKRGDVDMHRVGLMGLSLGGIAAIIAAARLPHIRAIVAEAAFADLLDDLGIAFTRFTGGVPAYPFANIAVFWGQIFTGARLSRIRPSAVIAQIAPRPVFIIGDLADTLVNEPEASNKLYGMASETKELWQIPDAGHVAGYLTDPVAYIDRLDAFFQHAL